MAIVSSRNIVEIKTYDIEDSINPGSIFIEKTESGKIGIHLEKIDQGEYIALDKDDLDIIIAELFS